MIRLSARDGLMLALHQMAYAAGETRTCNFSSALCQICFASIVIHRRLIPLDIA